MTREDILADYDVVNGVIQSPGKFELEMLYTPYFWDMFLDGMADDDDGKVMRFDVTDQDREQFPELANVRSVFLWENDQGFVSCTEDYIRVGRPRKHLSV